jgi:hypothetical protein
MGVLLPVDNQSCVFDVTADVQNLELSGLVAPWWAGARRSAARAIEHGHVTVGCAMLNLSNASMRV